MAKKKMTKAQLEGLGSVLEWQLEDLMEEYDSFIRARGGLYYKVKSRPIRLEIMLFDYDVEEYAKATLVAKPNGALEVTVFDVLNKKRVSKTTWKTLGPNPALRLWKLLSRAAGANEVWDSYR